MPWLRHWMPACNGTNIYDFAKGPPQGGPFLWHQALAMACIGPVLLPLPSGAGWAIRALTVGV